MSGTGTWSVGMRSDQVVKVFARRMALEDEGRLSRSEPPGWPAGEYGWHVLRCAYARADLEGVPFCWVCDDLADHLREVAKWSTKI